MLGVVVKCMHVWKGYLMSLGWYPWFIFHLLHLLVSPSFVISTFNFGVRLFLFYFVQHLLVNPTFDISSFDLGIILLHFLVCSTFSSGLDYVNSLCCGVTYPFVFWGVFCVHHLLMKSTIKISSFDWVVRSLSYVVYQPLSFVTLYYLLIVCHFISLEFIS